MSKRRIGDLIVLLVLAAFVVLYCLDAVRASADILNLILVLPLSGAVLALCAVQFALSARESRAAKDGGSRNGSAGDAEGGADGGAKGRANGSAAGDAAGGAKDGDQMGVTEARADATTTSGESGALPLGDVLPVIGLFAAYILTLPWLGFDVGTSLFLAAFLGFHGERRGPWLLGYSLGLGFALAFFFSRMLPYAMPMLLIGTS